MRKTIMSAVAVSFLLAIGTTSVFATGAIAVNDSSGTSAEDAGYAVGYGSTKKEASAAAIKECKSAGNSSCEVMLTFEQCGAYVGNKASYGTGIGKSEKEAQKAAMAECPECKLIVSDCH